jgi:site-specific DNA-methyltransferase (adenine-specific)
VWYKRDSPPSLADAELAWTSFDKNIKVIDQTIAATNSERVGHPTQKPLRVMIECIKYLPEISKTILDPFMGSGTTGVACAKMGRKFVGIELDEGYFDIACKRIEEAYRQPDMFVQSGQKLESQTEQASLFAGTDQS